MVVMVGHLFVVKGCVASASPKIEHSNHNRIIAVEAAEKQNKAAFSSTNGKAERATRYYVVEQCPPLFLKGLLWNESSFVGNHNLWWREPHLLRYAVLGKPHYRHILVACCHLLHVMLHCTHPWVSLYFLSNRKCTKSKEPSMNAKYWALGSDYLRNGR